MCGGGGGGGTFGITGRGRGTIYVMAVMLSNIFGLTHGVVFDIHKQERITWHRRVKDINFLFVIQKNGYSRFLFNTICVTPSTSANLHVRTLFFFFQIILRYLSTFILLLELLCLTVMFEGQIGQAWRSRG